MAVQLVLSRENIDESLSVYEIATQFSPIGWESVFERARPELQLVSTILSQLGPFFPLKKDLFRAFDECPLNQVKVVIFGQDPYHSTCELLVNGQKTVLPQANGMAFSTNRGCPIQPSLRNIYKELAEEYSDFVTPQHGDLSSWANQGVLLLNTCLTVAPHQAGSHKEIWNGFVTKVLDAVSEQNPECVYLLWGKKAQDMGMNLGQRAIKLTSSHPSPFSAARATKDASAFFGCQHFRTTNDYLVAQGKAPINWQIPS